MNILKNNQFLSHIFLARLQLLMRKTGLSRSDWISPLCILLLSCFSIAFIYSGQNYGASKQWLSQIGWISLGAGLYLAVSLINYKIYLENGHFLYIFSIILILLLWTPLGIKVRGCLRWVNLGISNIQPSESAKIATLIMAASILERSKIGSVHESFKVLLKVVGVFAIPIILIFLQPDLGSCLVFTPMMFSLLYASKLSMKFFITVFIFFILLIGLVVYDIVGYKEFIQKNNDSATRGAYEAQTLLPLKDYQRDRLLGFVAPEVLDPKGIGKSWNLRQSLISIGSGGLFGKGHNNGTQAKLGYLPPAVARNDFIFSVLGEEIGFVGGSLVILIYGILIINGIRIATLARDRFGMLLALGVSVILIVHVFVNIGMTIGLMPITGIPLPFLSYGGSFILCCCVSQGLIQSVYRFRRNFT